MLGLQLSLVGVALLQIPVLEDDDSETTSLTSTTVLSSDTEMGDYT